MFFCETSESRRTCSFNPSGRPDSLGSHLHILLPDRSSFLSIVSFIEPPQADVIEEILQHCGLWQSSTPRAPPDVDGLVLELDASYMDSSIDSQDQAEPPELTYIDIDPFVESF